MARRRPDSQQRETEGAESVVLVHHCEVHLEQMERPWEGYMQKSDMI